MTDAAQTELDPRFLPATDLIGRTGATGLQLRFSDEEQPVVWMAVAEYGGSSGGGPGRASRYEAAGAIDPLHALFRLCRHVIDGGTCNHCQRPSGFSEDFDQMPLDRTICWYQWDPETQVFRRGCEGDT